MAEAKGQAIARKGWLEEALFGVALPQVPSLVPGTVLAVAVVVVAILLADGLNRLTGLAGAVSSIMVAIILGVLVRNVVGVPAWAKPGIEFCLKKLLRLGIILMGIRLSIFDAAKIGAWGIPIVVLAITTGLVVTTLVTRHLNLPKRLGTLIAVGTGICGASAIVATAPGIGAKDEEVTYAVANITIFGLLAMFLYPYLSRLIFSESATMSGLFMGTSVHETAQVAGAALIYDQTFLDRAFSPAAGHTATDVAMVTKLVRNLFMVAVIPLMAYLYTTNAGDQGAAATRKTNIVKLFPIFVLGFLAMAMVRTVGDAGASGGLWDAFAWKEGTKLVTNLSGYTLATAMAGVGLGTALSAMRGLGIRPFYAGLVAATLVGVTSIVMVWLLGPHVRL